MIELLDELLDCFNNDYKYGFRDIKVKKVNGIFIKEEEDNNNFFEGGTGVILELISYIKNDTRFESALLLK